MSNHYYTKATLIAESSNGDLDGYPRTNKYTLEFYATDANVWTWVEQFRAFLRVQGFAEKTIKEALGEF